MDFRKFLAEYDMATGALVSSDWMGSEGPSGRPGNLPSTEMLLPSTKKSGVIASIERNNNPIKIVLNDGTVLYLTWDQFRRINGAEPAKGMRLDVVFQRHPQDRSSVPSKIDSILCY